MEIKELQDAVQAASLEVKELIGKQADEVKTQGEALAETKAALANAEAKLGDYEAQMKTLDEGIKEVQAKMARPDFGRSEEKPATLGAAYIASGVYQEAKSTNRWSTVGFEIKDITGSAGSALALARPDRDNTVYRTIGGMRTLRIADLIPSIPTSSGSVDVFRQTGFTNAAGPQQATVTPSALVGGGELQLKNKSNLAFSEVTIPIRTIATFVRTSRQVLGDAPMLAGVIDRELAYMLQLEHDAQLLYGDGTGQNMTGLLVDSGVQSVGGIDTGTAAIDVPAAMMDKVLEAITAVQVSDYSNVNGIVMHPADWSIIRSAKASDGHWLTAPFAATTAEPPQLWNVPVITTTAINPGDFILGDWGIGAQRYTREGVTIRTSENFNDDFVRNALVILGEFREALGVSRPLAFRKGSFEVEAT
jgi:HK97 family phage major capsid protein